MTQAKDDHLLFEQAPEPMWLVRLQDLRILDANLAASERLGFQPEHFIGSLFADFFVETDRIRLRRVLDARDPASPDLRGWKARASDGQVFDVDLAIRVITRDAEECALICALDMAAFRVLEDRLRQSGKMEAIGMLSGAIAHDFNNLLTIISGYSQLLLQSVSERNRVPVEQILKASERAAELTGQLLAFSRRGSIQPKQLDVNQIVSGMSTMLRRLIGEQIQLELTLDLEVGSVHADPGQLDQIIMNLAVNSRDAMPKGGKLGIRTSHIEIKTGAPKPGPYVLLEVTDSGIGMEHAVRERVFDPFFTTKEKGRGTGLGLWTVSGIAKQAGGFVELFSQPGLGTTVRVFLPQSGPPATGLQSATASATAAVATGGRETILVVEDEEAVQRLVRAALERAGYCVSLASSGMEAIRTLASIEKCDLLITDLAMPGMGGVELAFQVRDTRPEIGVLFVSGYTDQSLSRSEPLADAAFLQKPFTPSVLLAKVREVLDRRRVHELAKASNGA